MLTWHYYVECGSSPPPGAQSRFERWSLVFFTRPGNSVPLTALEDESAMISAAMSKLSPAERAKFRTGSTAKEWFARRIRNQRVNNRTVCAGHCVID